MLSQFFSFFTWRVDLYHIPFTTYKIYDVPLFGVPTLGWYYILFVVCGIYLLFSYANSKKQYGNYLYEKFGIILIGGKFNSGKTRLLAQFASDTYTKKNTFVISNFYNAYSFCQFSSFKDFCNILDDLLLLGEYQNFTTEEGKKIMEKFPGYFNNEEFKIFKKYRFIPSAGTDICNFVVEGDEFHQYLYNRSAMSNFSTEEGKKLLQTLHQVRHYNTLCVFSTQEIDELDLKLRHLASYEIDTFNFLNIWYGYNFFRYILNKRNTKEEKNEREFQKVNKRPILFLNGYFLNFILKDIENVCNRIKKRSIRYYNRTFKKNFIYKPIILPKFKKLDFETKFNVKLDKDIYTKEDIFRKLNDFYKKI